MVEQGTHKPLVGSSTLPPGNFPYGLGVPYSEDLQVVTTLVQLLILVLGLRNTYEVIRTQPNGLARE